MLLFALFFTACPYAASPLPEGIWNTELTNLEIRQSGAGELSFSFRPTNPPANTYTLYYIGEETDDAAYIIRNGTLRIVTGTSGTIPGLNIGETYSAVVVAKRSNYPESISNTSSRRIESVYINVSIQETGLDTVVSWTFIDEHGVPLAVDSNITLTYNYSGLAIAGGKLTATVISGTETRTLPGSARQHTINHGGLITVTDIVISATSGGEIVESVPKNTPSSIELRLYNIAYNKAREYGAIEMFSHGRNAPVTLGPTTDARGHTIINYDHNGNPLNLYGATFSRGNGGLSGAADASQLREWYYDGNYLYGRSNGGNTNIVDGTGASGAVTPSTTAARWANINSVLSGHSARWTAFSTAFAQSPFNYIPYNVNAAYTGLYQYKYTDPTLPNNSANPTNNNCRSDAPFGLIQTSTRGALAHNSNGTFEFTITMNANATGNRTNIEWSGNVGVTDYVYCYITFVIDADMRFVKYHVIDRYTVSAIINATSNTTAAMYFVYHQNNIDIGSYATFRPHQTRPNHVNFVPAGAPPELVIAPNGNTATGNMVVANSRYALTLDWTANANAASRISIPRP